MDKDYWQGRWRRGETGWHQSEAEPHLVGWLEGKSPRRIFVPLCGKSKDMKWMLDHGHSVVGAELSLQACEEFFRENGIAVETEERGETKIFRGERITIYCGDVFAVTKEDLGPIDAIYDRAALIALPREVRRTYTAHLLALAADSVARPGFEFLQIVLERNPPDEGGPPFSVTPAEVQTHYADRFEIEPRSRERVEATAPPGSTTEEHVFLLRSRRNGP